MTVVVGLLIVLAAQLAGIKYRAAEDAMAAVRFEQRENAKVANRRLSLPLLPKTRNEIRLVLCALALPSGIEPLSPP